MSGRRVILSSAMFALALNIAVSGQAIRAANAGDECLAKPSEPAPQGQHWYYRTDRANNNRQCWRLAPEGLPVQKASPRPQDATSSVPDAQLPEPQAMAAPGGAPDDAAPAVSATSGASAPPALGPKTPNEPVRLPAHTGAVSRPPGAYDAVAPVARDDISAATGAASEQGEPQHHAAERPSAPVAPSQQFSGIDRTFALLMVMFGLLGVTGPIIHFTHRQRQREVINYKPPRWAPVVPLNAPPPSMLQSPMPATRVERRPSPRPVQAADPPPPPAWRPASDPPRPLEPNERLTRALEQLIDQMRHVQPARPDAAPARPRLADVEMLKNAR